MAIRLVILGTMVLAPIVLAVTPTGMIEAGPRLCLFKNLTGMECPGCGLTRAFSHTMHGDLTRAYACNKMVTVVFPLALLLWLGYFRSQLKELGVFRRKDRSALNPGTSWSNRIWRNGMLK